MQHQQEIGGAQALLLLGTKSKEDDDTHDHDDHLNDTVEAAVMRYVGGTLDKKRSQEVNISDINQWILDDFDAFEEIEKETSKKKKKRKLMNVDPELAGLEEHDQLVQDVMNARDHIEQDNYDNVSIAQSATSLLKKKFKHITNIESLVEESSAAPITWFNSQSSFTSKGPRVFSQIETDAVDHFISGYCHLYNLTRTDICNRIWSSDRKKDNFWEPLTRVLPYRSRASVYKHVRRQYHVFDVRAKWLKEDDELLRKLSLSQEGRWKEVGEAMGRMPEDCRDRWRNYVKCGENRASNKWSEAEERQLTDIVTEFIAASKQNKNPTINWTIISDKMNGIRSRIQCRYKWNKLIKRESALRAAYMTLETKMWLLHKLQQFSSLELVDWKYILDVYNQEFKLRLHEDKFVWDIPDFKAGFDLLKQESGDIRGQNTDFQGYIRKLIHERTFADGDESEDEKEESSNIASAAVAAAATSLEGDSAQPQEYSLWR